MMEQRLRCRPREGRGLYRQPRFVQHRRRHVAVPARGAGCIGVVRKKNNFITLLPSPWGEMCIRDRLMPERRLVQIRYSRISYGPGCKDIVHSHPYETGMSFYIPYLEARELCLIAAAHEE